MSCSLTGKLGECCGTHSWSRAGGGCLNKLRIAGVSPSLRLRWVGDRDRGGERESWDPGDRARWGLEGLGGTPSGPDQNAHSALNHVFFIWIFASA